MLLNCSVGEDPWESLGLQEIQPVHSEGDQPWDFFGRNDAKAESPVLWPPHVKSWLIGKDSDAGRGWGQEEKGTTEDEMVGWHHRLDRHEFEQALRVGHGQRGLACCGPWGHKESDTTERMNWTELNWMVWSPCSPRDSQESSPTSQVKSINSSVLSFLYGPTLTSIHDYWKTHSFD